MSVPVMTIWADPRAVDDAAKTTAALAAALNLSPADTAQLQQRLAQPNAKSNTDKSEFEYVQRQVDEATADKVKALNLNGIYEYEESKRFYPSDQVAQSVIGSTDTDGKGISGLELQYNDLLTGTPGELIRERDRQGRTIPTGRREVVPAQAGDDLRLTLDRNLQYEAEQFLLEQVGATQRPWWHGDRDGQPHRRPGGAGQRAGRRPDRPARAGQGQPRRRRHVRARLGEQGDHRLRGHPGGHRHPGDDLRRALPVPVRRPRLHRRRAAQGRPVVAAGHRRALVEHRHDQARRDAGQRPARELPAGPSASAIRPRSTSPARRRACCPRTRSGEGPRTPPSPTGRASA